MPLSARTRLRAIALLTACLVAAGLAVALPAQADTSPASGVPATVSSDPLPTAQVDGVVWSTAIAGSTVYAGGDFDYARPAGAALGSNQSRRYNLMAFSLSTGVMTSFAPNVNGAVLSVAVSPDGSTLYIAGSFTQVNGSTRNRVAAFSTSNGSLKSWAPSVNAKVSAIKATNSTVFIGGSFTSVAGSSRARVAGVSASSGAVTGLNANVQGGSVLALVVSPDASKVVIGGHFTSINGSNNPGYGMGAINASTGATMSWSVNSTIRQAGDNQAIYSLTSDSTSVYGTAYIYPFGGKTLEGAFRAEWSTGSLTWIESCNGDSYSVAVNSTVAYIAGHPHDCDTNGGWSDQNPRVYQRAMAWSKATGSSPNTGTWSGVAAPTMLNWWPAFNTGTATGQNQGPWNITATDTYVVYAGEFTRVNSTNQQGLVRFAPASIAPNDDGPRVSGSDFVPTLTSPTAGQVRVAWTSNYDRDNEFLTYEVIRDGATVSSTTGASRNWWRRPALSFTDTGLSSGSHIYRLRATDPFGNSVTGDTVSITVAGATGGGGGGGTTPTGSSATDTFNRSATGSWGNATSGGAWTSSSGTTGYYSVADQGKLTLPASKTAEAYLTGVTSSNANVSAQVSFSAVPQGSSAYASVIGRRIGTDDYRARAVVGSDGSVNLQLQRSGSTIASQIVAGLSVSANTQYQIRLQVTGTAPTTIRAKIWRAGTSEPSSWTVTTTDATAALQNAGHTGLGGYLGSSTTNGPIVISFDDFALSTP
ncbi:hypothetical protein [Naasia lichenicola]|uniref:Fibronectin type-III domain-containing protein n=1 Tax=Naasia lichenicola TaxID=2565933 RepID=A0A4S4FK94_9MICO|nr:hypothetical protein [Naasia lichenicola]THG30800.1 hypothetical protein E6C64_09180 [Naasia lichenicola]